MLFASYFRRKHCNIFYRIRIAPFFDVLNYQCSLTVIQYLFRVLLCQSLITSNGIITAENRALEPCIKFCHLALLYFAAGFPVTFNTLIFFFSQPSSQPTILHVCSMSKFIEHHVKLCQPILFGFGKLAWLAGFSFFAFK